MDELLDDVISNCRKADFLETVLEKAHYSSGDRELLWNVCEQILECMEADAAWSGKIAGGAKEACEVELGGKAKEACEAELGGKAKEACEAELGGKAEETGEAGSAERGSACEAGGDARAQEVVITLGRKVDELQEDYLRGGKLTEAYMVEVLGSEILLKAYGAYNAWIRRHTDYSVMRYHFLGAEEGTGKGDGDKNIAGGKKGALACGLEALPGILKRSGLAVTCTEGFCMIPKKSVAFYAEMTMDQGVTCEGVCVGCGRKDCPNRMEAGTRLLPNRTLDRPLTYGYARILGL